MMLKSISKPLNFSISALLSAYILYTKSEEEEEDRSSNFQQLIFLSIYGFLSYFSIPILHYIDRKAGRVIRNLSEGILITLMVISVIEVLGYYKGLTDEAMIISSVLAIQLLVISWYFNRDPTGFVNGVMIGFLLVSIKNCCKKDEDYRSLHVFMPLVVLLIAVFTKINET